MRSGNFEQLYCAPSISNKRTVLGAELQMHSGGTIGGVGEYVPRRSPCNGNRPKQLRETLYSPKGDVDTSKFSGRHVNGERAVKPVARGGVGRPPDTKRRDDVGLSRSKAQ
jgi:hypothetical protein